ARCSEDLHVCELSLCDIACALALSKLQQRLGRPRAGVQITDVPNFGAPHFGAKHCSTGLKIDERLRGSALGEPEPRTGGWDQDCADTRRPALRRKRREQRLGPNKPARLDRDIS